MRSKCACVVVPPSGFNFEQGRLDADSYSCHHPDAKLALAVIPIPILFLTAYLDP
jgi:hypothetical protein